MEVLLTCLLSDIRSPLSSTVDDPVASRAFPTIVEEVGERSMVLEIELDVSGVRVGK
jgi:hypothetical protein